MADYHEELEKFSKNYIVQYLIYVLCLILLNKKQNQLQKLGKRNYKSLASKSFKD